MIHHIFFRYQAPSLFLVPFLAEQRTIVHHDVVIPSLCSGFTFCYCERKHPSISLPATSLSDIVLLSDDFVRIWKHNDPDLALLELHEMQASAEKIKTALLNPSSSRSNITRASRHSSHSNTHQHSHIKIRTRANVTLMPSNLAFEAAKVMFFQAQKEANICNKERFRNPYLNKFNAKFDRADAVKARAADAAAMTPNETESSMRREISMCTTSNFQIRLGTPLHWLRKLTHERKSLCLS
jgi:hypothetical protein